MSSGERMIIGLHSVRDSGFRKLWRSGFGSDLTLIVEGRHFYVHSFPIRAAIPEFVCGCIYTLHLNGNTVKISNLVRSTDRMHENSRAKWVQ